MFDVVAVDSGRQSYTLIAGCSRTVYNVSDVRREAEQFLLENGTADYMKFYRSMNRRGIKPIVILCVSLSDEEKTVEKFDRQLSSFISMFDFLGLDGW